MSGANTYSGATTISAGSLTAGGANTFSASSATSVATGGTLNLGGFAEAINAVTLNGGTVTSGSLTGAVTSTGGTISTISGSAGITETAGTTTFTGTNSYTGATAITGGTALAGAANTFSSGSATSVATGGTLSLGGFAEAINAVTLNGGTVTNGSLTGAVTSTGGTISTISGSAGITATAGTTTFTGTNSYTGVTAITGGTALAGAANTFSASSATSVATGGTLNLGGFAEAINAVTLNGGTVTNGSLTGALTSTGGTINALGGPASVTTTAGLTKAIGTSSYTGATAVNGGTLEVDGSVASSNVVVNNGGTLSGTGTIGDTTIAPGGTLSPGSIANSSGTLTIVGPLAFAPGSFYNVAITPTANSRTNVTGAVTIGGGTVVVAAGAGTYGADTRYTILNATGGVNGTFSAVSSNLAFLTPTLSYDASDVFLTIQAGTREVPALVAINPVTGAPILVPNYTSAATTQIQFNVATGLTNAGVANGGTGKILTAFNQLTVAQAQAAFNAISGEGITAAQGAANRSTQAFNAAIFDETTFYGSGGTNSITLTAPQPGFFAYAPQVDTPRSPIHELADLPSRAMAPAMPTIAPARTWRAWGSGFGGVDTIHGNSAVGSASQTDSLYGGALGVDYQLTPDYLVGIAVGGSDGFFSVPGRTTSGETTGGHIAFYDLATFGKFYGASSNSFSYFTNRTTRSTGGFGGLVGETDRGSFDSHEFRSRLEFGRHFDGFGGTVTPFIALELADLRSNGFDETAVAGPGLLALNVSGQSSASVPSFVGARFQGVTHLGGGMTFTPTLQAAYVHEFAPQRSQFGTLVNLPGSTFLADGATPSRDAGQAKVGGELALNAHSILFANFDGEFSGSNQYYGGHGGFKYVW